jgi:hypothetical protein
MFMYDLVDLDLKNQATHESYPCRLILQRLMPYVHNAVFASSSVSILKNTTAVNFCNSCLGEFTEDTLDKFSIDRFVSGVGASPENITWIENYLQCHSRWVSQGVLNEFPDLDDVLRHDQFLNELERDETTVKDTYKTIIDDVMNIKCPKCKSAFESFSGCFALTCVYLNCQCHFCAWCLQDCGTDAHEHVLQCSQGNRTYHGSLEAFTAHHTRRRAAEIQNIFRNLSPRCQRLLHEKLSKNLLELGISIAVQPSVDDTTSAMKLPEMSIPTGN